MNNTQSTVNYPNYPSQPNYSEFQTKKSNTKYFIFGLIVGGTVVACMKDDSETIKDIGSTITKIATSYYGCKLIYKLLS